jgi:hypothetical protein
VVVLWVLVYLLLDIFKIVQFRLHVVHHKIFFVIYHIMVEQILVAYVYVILHGHIGMVQHVQVNYQLVVNVQMILNVLHPVAYFVVIIHNQLVNVIVVKVIFGIIHVY